VGVLAAVAATVAATVAASCAGIGAPARSSSSSSLVQLDELQGSPIAPALRVRGSLQGVVEVDVSNLAGTEIAGLSLQELLSPGAQFCNASAPLPTSRPRTFEFPDEWRRTCESLTDHPDGAAAHKHRNWCWVWMKYEGCLWSHGHWSWWEAQERLAMQVRAPDPHAFPFQPILNAPLCERPVLGASQLHTTQQAAVAQRWLVDNVAIYVLNLPQDVERWSRMKLHLDSLGLTATHVSGVDMTETGMLELARQEDLVPEAYNLAAAQRFADADDMGGITGTIGVASAHFRALGTAYAEREAKPLALILEDDTELVEDFAIRLWRLLAEVPCDWAALSLKSRCPFGECVTPHLTRVQPDGNEPAERCRHGVNYGFYAMLYKSSELGEVRQKLRETVWQEDRPRCLDIDVALASISDEVAYYAVPAVQQPGFLHEGQQGSARYTKNFVKISDIATPSHNETNSSLG